MGKATIVSGGADGNYQVRLDYGKTAQANRLATIGARLAELVDQIALALHELNTMEYTGAQLEEAVQVAINAYVAAVQSLAAVQQANAPVAAVQAAEAQVKSTLKAHTDALVKLADVVRKTAPLRLAWQLLKNEQVQLQKDAAKWSALVLEETVQAWCADLTESAAGEVATVEIPGEDKLVLIAPSAPAPAVTSGVLTAREVQTAPQVFLNAAILPGWQKFKPTFRRGIITALDTEADMANVTLTDDKSSAQALGINKVSTLSNVPVEYMSCNAGAFDVGDACVVQFLDQDWSKPKVVGFVSNPKGCDAPDLHLVFIQSSGASAQQIVNSYGVPGVNQCGPLRDAGVYRSVGVSLASGKTKTGFAVTVPAERETYQVAAFYDGLPVLVRTTVNTRSTTSEYQPAPEPFGAYDTDVKDTRLTLTTREVTHGDTVLLTGTYQTLVIETVQIFNPPFAAEPNTRGETMTSRGIDTMSNWMQTMVNPADLPALSVIKTTSPWAAWSVVAGDVTTGVGEGYQASPNADYEILSQLPEPVFTKYSLGAPKRGAASRPIADLEAMPAKLALSVPREYTASMVAANPPGKLQATPLDRHLLDFGYLPNRMDGVKIRATCKSHVYCWLEGEGVTYEGAPTIRRVNYKTGAASNIDAPQLFKPAGDTPPDYMPKNLVLYDDYIVRCENDLGGPYFWVWVYSQTMVLLKRITNKLGDLGVGFEDVLQVTVPGLPGDSYLIGAMRDEVSAM